MDIGCVGVLALRFLGLRWLGWGRLSVEYCLFDASVGVVALAEQRGGKNHAGGEYGDREIKMVGINMSVEWR